MDKSFLSGFRHFTSIQVRFKDVDKMGHVNNANHLTYFELARMGYFREVISEPIDWSRDGIILARAEIDYRFPVLLDDDVRVWCRVGKLGKTSFDFIYAMTAVRHDTEVILAEGRSVQVCFNYELNKPVEIPSSWRRKVLEYEDPLFLSV